ncbi:transglycosylase domain-containing protein [Hyphomonas sp.]|uniref:transglycosylase domain-containing protein n=1 Tax=Hyphomonas sp. TaxID=87 RepID=UPI0025BAEE22|nr:transglycosylase domain-containing protein [Hyphomonas sp.]
MRFLVRIFESVREVGIGLARWTTRGPAVAVKGGQRRTVGVFLLIAFGLYFGALFWFGWLNGVLLINGKARWNAFQFADQRAKAVALYDSEGRYFGIVHPETENDHLGEFERTDLTPFGASPDHKAVPVAEAPPYFWRCVVYTEDRHRGEWRNRYGVDVGHLARLPVSQRGGSTIEMQLARSMWKMHSRNSNPMWRKLHELSEAPVLNRYLVKDGDTRGLERWFSQHIPLVQGGGDEQGSIYGVYAAGQFLFGKRAEELDPAEQLVLAAAVRRPIAWPASEERRAEILYDLIGVEEDKRRALLCASDEARLADGTRVIEDKRVRLATQARLAELRVPANVGHTDAAFLEILRRDGMTAEAPLLAPMRLAKELAPNLQSEVVAELTDLLAPLATAQATKAVEAPPVKGQPTRLQGTHPWRGRVREVEVTLDVAKNSEFRARAREAAMTLGEDLEKTGRYRKGALPQRVVSDLGSLSIKEGDTALVIAAADENGRIVRYYNTSAMTAYSGYGETRPMIRGFGRGAYDRSFETRSVGSVAKLAAALLLAEGGASDAGRTVSNACMPGLQQRCSTPDVGATPARVTLSRAFGSSLNPAVVRALGEGTTLARTIELMDTLGFYLPERHRQTPMATNLALGRFAGRPRAVHWLAAATLQAARGETRAVTQPFFVERYRLIEPVAGGDFTFRLETPARTTLALKEGIGEAQAQFLRAVLSQPICDTRDGTLRRLSSWCAAARKEVAVHVAKTGSVSSGPAGGTFDESDLWIAGGIEFADGRAYSYVISLGAGSPRGAFTKDMGGGVLAPLADVLLRDLLEDAP